MNRRDFIRRVPLVVVASAVAVEEAKAGLLTRWRRRLFPGYGPGTITRTLHYQNPYAQLDEAMRRIYSEPFMSDLFAESELMALLTGPGVSTMPDGPYIPLYFDLRTSHA